MVEECNGVVGELDWFGGLVRVQRPSYKIIDNLNESIETHKLSIPVDNSHKAVMPSLPLDKMYLLFLENLTDETILPPWASLNVLIQRLLTPSQT